MSGKRPNIIIIIVDNMPADVLGCYGKTLLAPIGNLTSPKSKLKN